MARIVGGFAVSHTPTIAFAHDANKQDDPVWAPIFQGFEPVKEWLRETKPDVIVYIYNDHMTSFNPRHYSQFALGIGEVYEPADEGGGQRDVPPLKGDPELAQHIAFGMVADEFDLSYWQGMGMDHGAFSPLSVMLDYDEGGWPCKIVPIQCGVLELPIPSAKRFWKFGRSLRKALQNYPKDIKIAIAGTGGLSHQVHGERCGFNNTAWDMEFMERLEKDPEGLLNIPIAKLAELGGMEGAEIVMWMMMRGALSKKVNKLHQSYFLPSMTAIATLLFENDPDEPVDDETHDEYMTRIMWDYADAAGLEGTYPFTIERSVKGWRMNEYLHSLTDPAKRQAFQADRNASLAAADLTDEERALIRDLKWIEMIHYGVSFFMLEKLAAVVGVGNIDVYAAFKGLSVPEFQKTRNAAINYGVAGTK
ncbi:MAG: gallate dioxygenase [Croceibacterium sp.]